MMEQYLRLKEKHKDKLLLYRMGDFYELFFEDAEVASSAMDITLTTRGKHLEIDIPMCGIPHLKLDQYLIKLIKAGHNVAICEQIESVNQAKKRGYKSIVKRDVTRIITPGTLVEEGHLESPSHNFLFTYAEKNKTSSAAWLDLSTGNIFLKNIDRHSILTLIGEIKPSEVIFCSNIFSKLLTINSNETPRVSVLEKNYFFDFGDLRSYIKLDETDSYSDAETHAMSSLLTYCHRTNFPFEMTFSTPVRISNSKFVEMDFSTRNNLELTQNTKGGRQDTLFSTIDNTVTNFGSRLLENWLNYPLMNISDVNSRLDKVELLFENLDVMETVQSFLKKIPDMERALTRLQLNRGNPKDYIYIKSGLSKSREIDNFLKRKPFAGLFDGSLIRALENIWKTLEDSLEDDPSLSFRDGNFIKKGCSIELDENRSLQESSRVHIANIQVQLIEKTHINSLKIKYNNTLGYFIETPASHSKTILSEEYSELFFHRQTTANSIRFTTNELLALESKILTSRELCLQIETEKLEELRLMVLSYGDKIRVLCRSLAELDIFCSGASLAKKNRWVRPEITEGKDFLIKNGRHPVVEKSLRVSNSNDFIPNSCELLEKKSFINLLTGPNMAGKSTFLRQNALIGILAQIGSYVPADSAKIGRISQVFCRIGASDNLAKGESTFMVEMRETASILNNADNRALVILDEVGRGTSTYDGMSIAWACLEYLHDHNKARTIFATHYHELTNMSEDFIGIQNLSVSAKEWKGDLIFLHKVLEGKAVGSYGIKVAELAGLPKKVIKISSDILDKLSRESNFSQLTKSSNKENTNEKEIYDKKLKILMETIDDLDLDSTTPKLALEILYKVKTRLIEV